MTKKISLSIVVLSLFVAAITSSLGCEVTSEPAPEPAAAAPEEYMVQVWTSPELPEESRKLLSFGFIAGDGSQVLTFIDYEDFTPGDLEVVTNGYGEYKASVKAIDPRTGITLLKLEGASGLPAARISNEGTPDYGQKVIIWGWNHKDYTTFKSSDAGVLSDQAYAPRPLFFSVRLAQGETYPVDAPGAAVTDFEGKILGLTTTFHMKLVAIMGYWGMMPPAASISSGAELLSGKTARSSWAKGPAISLIANSSRIRGYVAGILPSPSDYGKMTDALAKLQVKLGEPVDTGDLDLAYLSPWNQSLEGTMLIVVYPRPVELKSARGEALASAKWVGIDWGRGNGKPNRLVYGSETYVIEGGFALPGDISDLQQSLPLFDTN